MGWQGNAIRLGTGAAALGLMATPLAAEEGGYFKVPDGDGYVTVMTHPAKAQEREGKAGEEELPQVPGVTWDAEETRRADTAHGSRLTGIRAHQPAASATGATRAAETEPADTAHGSRLTGIRAHKPVATDTGETESRDAAAGLATGKRQHKPLSATKPVDKASPLIMRAAASWDGCEVGASYDHILLGDGEGKEYRLEQVTVAACDRERVSFKYDKFDF